MKKPLRLLVIEDSEDDAELLALRLRDAGYDLAYDRVQTADEMARALDRDPNRDLILSDYSLPMFNAPVALTILKQSGLDIPFIIVSGSIGEERAVSTMRAGARDFILKHDLDRLIPVIERELREADARRLRRKVEQAYKASEQRYRTIVNTAREGIWLVDGAGDTTFVNRYFASMLGLHEQDILTRPFVDFVDADDRTKAREFFERRVQGGTEQIDLRLWRPDAAVVDVMISGTSMSDDVSGFQGCLMMVTDVTERKLIEAERLKLLDELQVAVKVRDEFLSIASHELRTPLTSMKLQTQIRQRLVARGDPAAFPLDKLGSMFDGDMRLIERLTRLIDDMLDIARISAGKMTIEREAFDLCELVKEVTDRHRAQLEASGTEVDLEICDTLVGHWDRFRIEQVYLNLLTNAVKYGAGKPIRIRVETVLGKGRISVADQGMGIAKEHQTRIFQRFERAISANAVSGLGLGLYIARQIVEMHGGAIWVDSEVGKGSTFTVELPRHP